MRRNRSAVAFRVDASTEIGTGHLVRCITLAKALAVGGARIRFVCRHVPEHLHGVLAELGFELALLDAPRAEAPLDDLAHAAWLGTTQRRDAGETAAALSDVRWDWLVVDHYALSQAWEVDVRSRADRILAIDDIADRPHDCDLLLDQNLYSNMPARYAGKAPDDCRLLLGPKYALLREEFRAFRERVAPRTGPVRRLLVFLGGMDADNYTGTTLEALTGLPAGGPDVDVVIGAAHRERDAIAAECVRRGYACHMQTGRMAELMAAADLAIGAGGSASWERCCLGLPALLVSLADNQTAIARALGDAGAARYLGTSREATAERLRLALLDLMRHPDALATMADRAYALADGAGTDRVRAAMLG